MKHALVVFALLAAFAAFARKGVAHEVRPAYLELRQTGTETWSALWKVPGQGENLASASTWNPVGCTSVAEPRDHGRRRMHER
jgi:hypothetical protein